MQLARAITKHKGFIIALAVAAWLGLEVGGKGTGVVNWALSPGAPPDQARSLCEAAEPVIAGELGAASPKLSPSRAEVRAEYDVKIAHHTEAIREKSDDVDAYLSRGFAYYKRRRLEEAIGDYSEAIRLRPDDGRAYHGRAVARDAKAEYEGAIEDWSEAIRLGSSGVDAYIGRGYTHLRFRRYDQAIADYSEAIRLGPCEAFAYYGRGLAYIRRDNHDQAIADYSTAIRLKPDLDEFYLSRGRAYFQKGEYRRGFADAIEESRLLVSGFLREIKQKIYREWQGFLDARKRGLAREP